MHKKHPLIRFVRWGSAYTIGNTIYLNRALLSNPGIFRKMVTHEMKHIRGLAGVDWNEKWDWNIFWWKLSHPSSWPDLIPIWWHGGRRISIDWNRIMFWVGIQIGFVCLYLIWRFFK